MVNIIQLTSIFAATEEVSGIGALGIDPLAILAQATTFLLLFWVIKKFALSKIVATLETRHKTIEDGIRLGREMEAEKAKLDDRIAQGLKEARKEADRVIALAHEESGGILKAAEDKSAQKTDDMLKEAHARISEDIETAKKGLETEMRSLVAEATEAIIKTKLDPKQDEKLLRDVFEKIKVESR